MSPTQARARAWKKIATFYGLTILFTAPFELLDMRAQGNIILTTGSMWSPALAAVVTLWLFGEGVRGLSWGWGSWRYPGLAYLIPLAYALPVYLLVWLSGLGGFAGVETVSTLVKEYGLDSLPLPLALGSYVLIVMTAGFLAKTGRALGEEIGWRGFLVPELAKVTGFFGIGMISGLMWALWHFPSIIFSDYNMGTPAPYALACFTIMVVSGSFIAAWLQLKSNSLWPAAIYHGSHNMFVQMIFTPLTTDTGVTYYIVDEFGVGMAITSALGALIVWRKRGDLSLPH